MLRVLASNSSRNRLAWSRSHRTPFSRSFFSFGGSQGGKDGDGDDDKKDDDKKDDDKDKDKDKDNSTDSSTDTTSGSINTTSLSRAIAPSTKLKYGDDAPRYPHTLALPLVSRPLFPGVFTSVTISDAVSFFHHHGHEKRKLCVLYCG